MEINDSRVSELKDPIYVHKKCRCVVNYRENTHYVIPFKWNGSKYVRDGNEDSYNYPEENFYDCPKCEDQVEDIEVMYL